MHVRLCASWIDPRGTVWAPGDTVDVDAVTLAELEEMGMVEQPEGQSSSSTESTTSSKNAKTDPQKIGPGPSSPPADTKEK
ncbi:hypothetical protein [Micromonospora narathiwatensis]|uniref:Uncharacterized protein n=1 Tax=Micromonospora narathiwatensis TaxID=299146 RepID=A0A1A8ZX60_9ACTN|nr:hypothetical protein [Micromonospora narathiwatensis]SBT48468.1 hypothetical protein GA0070621_3176 [Micromonospora narathiwatensis]